MNHIVFLSETGQVFGTGENNCGQLKPKKPKSSVALPSFFKEEDSYSRIITLPLPTTVDTIVCGNESTFFHNKETNELFATGGHIFKPAATKTALQPGGSDSGYFSFTPYFPKPELKLMRVVTQFKHTFLEFENNTWYGFADNSFGQLSQGHMFPQFHAMVNVSLPNEVIVDVKVGLGHTLFLTASGNVYAVGRNNHGQLGWLGEESSSRTLRPILLEQFKDNAMQIGCGTEFSVVLTRDGNLYFFGTLQSVNFEYGVLARPNDPKRIVAKDVQDLKVEKILKCGPHHLFFLSKDNKLYSFGLNSNSQLGIPSDNSVGAAEKATMIRNPEEHLFKQQESKILFAQQVPETSVNPEYLVGVAVGGYSSAFLLSDKV